MKARLLPGVMILAAGALLPAMAFAQPETEPNDTKAQANLVTLPAVNTPAVITGNSVATTGVGLDYFRVTTATQATAGFYRHRLIAQSTTPGHTVHIRGLNQVAGVPGTTDSTLQASSAATTPPRFIQWYTSEAPADIFVRVNGAAATTADYSLDYEVQVVTPVVGPLPVQGSITITSVGQSAPQTDTDLWVYDSTRTAIVGFGNDDEFGTTSLGSVLTRTYLPGTFYLAISNFNIANNLGSPADDDFRTGIVMDFPGAIANSSTTLNLDVDTLIGGLPAPATKVGAFDVVFVQFVVQIPVELMDFQIE